MISMTDYSQWTWNHYVSVWGEREFSSYKNGIFLGTNVVTQDLEPYKNINRINFNGPNSNQIEIDDFRFYDHKLSIKEIKELSKAKILHYKFDSSDNILDCSGNNNHGTNNGATFSLDSKIGNGCYSFDGADDYIEL
jgi:hypothetical protein